jgi:flagellin-like hook-associated protein FlgL
MPLIIESFEKGLGYYIVSALTALASTLSTGVANLQSQISSVQNELASGVRTLNPGQSGVVTRLSAQVAGYNAVQNNITFGQNIISVAQTGLTSIASIIQQMQGLATQASSAGLSDSDLASLNATFQSLQQQVSNIANGASVNGSNLLLASGSANIQTSIDASSQTVVPSVGIDTLVSGWASGGLPGTYSQESVTFPPLSAGQTVTVAGLTFTSGVGGATAIQVANAFTNLADGVVQNSTAVAGGTLNGALTGWSTVGASVNNDALTFTATTTGPNTITVSNNGIHAVNLNPTTTVTGVAPGGGTYAQQNVQFNQMASNTTATVGGITFTASQNLSAILVAQIFTSLSTNGTNPFPSLGSFTGAVPLSSYVATNIGSGVVNFTATALGPNSLAVSGNVSASIVTPLNQAYVSVQQTGATPVTGSAAQQTISFNALATGDSATVGGLTFTANTDLTAAQVATIFYQAIHDAYFSSSTFGNFSNLFQGGYSLTYPGSGSSITFTANATGPNSIAISGNIASTTTPLSSSNIAVSVPGIAEVFDSYGQQNITFNDMNSGETVVVGGLSFTPNRFLSASSVAGLFWSYIVNGAVSPWGNWSGNFQLHHTFSWTPGDNFGVVTSTVFGPNNLVTATNASSSTVSPGSYASTGVYQQQTIAVNKLNAGDTATIGNLTFTAAMDLSINQVGYWFAQGINTGNIPGYIGSFGGSSFVGGYNATYSNGSQLLTLTATSYGSKSVVPVSGTVTSRVALTSSNITTLNAGSTGVAGVYPQQTVTLQPLNSGDSATIGGLTFTAAADLTGAQVASIFADKTDSTNPHNPSGSLGSFTGSLIDFYGSNIGGSAILSLVGKSQAPAFTVSVAGNVINRVAPSSTMIDPGSNAGQGSGTAAQQNVLILSLNNGNSATIGGLTLTANSDLTATDVATIFSNKINSSANNPVASLGSFSGNFVGGFTSTSVGNLLTLTGVPVGPKALITATSVVSVNRASLVGGTNPSASLSISSAASAKSATSTLITSLQTVSTGQSTLSASSTGLAAMKSAANSLSSGLQGTINSIQNIDPTELEAKLQSLNNQQSIDYYLVSQMNTASAALLSIFR